MIQYSIITELKVMAWNLIKVTQKYLVVFLWLSSLVFFIVGGALLINSYYSAQRMLHPDAGLSPPEFITKYNYPVESHKIQTKDGYILTTHRIPYGYKEKNPNRTRPAILLVHGLIGTSADWILLGPKKSLGFLLADAGFDVWLANTRGCTWSRQHATIDADENPKEFFDFSFHELGIYDLPATIDYIKKTSNQTKITYVGFSQGTSALFAMAAEKPKYIDSIGLMIGLAPIGRLTQFTSPFASLGVKLNFLIEQLTNVIYEVFPRSDYFTKNIINFCNSVLKETCSTFLFLFYGFDYSQLDRDLLPVIFTGIPASASSKQVVHYFQLINAGKFQRYDHGIAENIKRYGQETPPVYNITKNTIKTILYHGPNDGLATTKDVENLAEELPNVISRKLVSYPQFTHGDFLWATDIYELVNKFVIEDVKMFGETDHFTEVI